MQLLALALFLAQAATPAAVPPAAPPAPPAPTGPVVAFDVAQGRTVFGTITIALDPEKAPISVRNFLKYVRSVSVASESILPLFLMGSFSWTHCRLVVFPHRPGP